MMIDHDVMQALQGDETISSVIDKISKEVMVEIKKDFPDEKDEYAIMLLTTLTEFAELTGQLIQAHGLDADSVLSGPMQTMCGCVMKLTGYDKDRMVKLAQAATRLRNAVREGVQQRGQVLIAEQERGSTTVH